MTEHTVVYRQYNKYILYQYIRNPDYNPARERYRLALYTAAYQPQFTDTYHDIPPESLVVARKLTTFYKGQNLWADPVAFRLKKCPIIAGFCVWLAQEVPLLVYASRFQVPLSGPRTVRLSFGETFALETSHAYHDALCIRELLQEGALYAA